MGAAGPTGTPDAAGAAEPTGAAGTAGAAESRGTAGAAESAGTPNAAGTAGTTGRGDTAEVLTPQARGAPPVQQRRQVDEHCGSSRGVRKAGAGDTAESAGRRALPAQEEWPTLGGCRHSRDGGAAGTPRQARPVQPLAPYPRPSTPHPANPQTHTPQFHTQKRPKPQKEYRAPSHKNARCQIPWLRPPNAARGRRDARPGRGRP